MHISLFSGRFPTVLSKSVEHDMYGDCKPLLCMTHDFT